MRGSVAFAIGPLVAFPVFADWNAMTGDEISEVLTDGTLQYAAAKQEFYAGGRTLYDAGGASWGKWWVQGDQYCSSWPPASGSACYDMERNIETGNVRFIGQSGNITKGVVVE